MRYLKLDSQELVKRLYDAYGPRRLMWGTDWPIIEGVAKYQQALTVVRDDMKPGVAAMFGDATSAHRQPGRGLHVEVQPCLWMCAQDGSRTLR